MKRTFTILLFVLLTAAVGWLYWDRFQAPEIPDDTVAEAPEPAGDPVAVQILTADPVRPPAVPPFVVFAGDTIRFDRVDLRERMDRELIAFTYSHSNSLLMLKRSARIFPQVEPLLKANGVPDDLKYLMAVESNLSETAVSTAGAAGLWQFMKEVGREYGLEVSLTVDERFHLKKETVAACDYLKKSYARFGDWMTVAASYNGGMNGVTRRLAAQKQAKALDLHLVEETSRYMFRILVAKLFFEDPAAFGFDPEAVDAYPYIPPKRTVTVSGAIEDLAEFAGRHGVSYAQLRRANPWLRDTRLDPARGKTYEISIPDLESERVHCLESVLNSSF